MRKNRRHYLENEDYSMYPLVDLSIETFKHFDTNEIEFNGLPIMGMGVQLEVIESFDNKIAFNRELKSLLDDINIVSDFRNKELNRELKILMFK